MNRTPFPTETDQRLVEELRSMVNLVRLERKDGVETRLGPGGRFWVTVFYTPPVGG